MMTGNRERRSLLPFTFCLLSLLFLLTGCSTGVIRGVVVDSAGRPIENANIQTLPPTHAILSTKDGFIMQNVQDGEYTLIVSKEGYKTGSAQVEVRPKKVTYANVVLDRAD